MKKGQDLSLNVIIVAALALIVLVVLVAIFTGRIGGFGKGTQEVQSQASSCATLCTTQGYKSGNTVVSSEKCQTYEFTGEFDGKRDAQGTVVKNCCCTN